MSHKNALSTVFGGIIRLGDEIPLTREGQPTIGTRKRSSRLVVLTQAWFYHQMLTITGGLVSFGDEIPPSGEGQPTTGTRKRNLVAGLTGPAWRPSSLCPPKDFIIFIALVFLSPQPTRRGVLLKQR